MGISKGSEANYKNLNQSFLSSTGGGTITGNYVVSGNFKVGTAIELRGHNDSSLGSDLFFYSDSFISAEDSMIFVIDNDNNTTNESFQWRKDTDTFPGGSDLMELKETGKLYIYDATDSSLSDDGALTIGAVGGYNITLDSDEIMARNNGAGAPLYLNRDGSVVYIGNSAITLNSNGAISTTSTINADGTITGPNDGLIQSLSTVNSDNSGSFSQLEIDSVHLYNNLDGELYIEGARIDGSTRIGIGTGESAAAAGSQNAQNVEIGGKVRITTAGGWLEHNQSSPSGTTVLGYNGYFYATRFYNAVYGDLAEFMPYKGPVVKPGDVMIDIGDSIIIANKRADTRVIGVYSDNYGFALGGDNKSDNQIPVGLSGKIKVKVSGKVKIGDELVSYKDGSAIKANILERIFHRGAIIGKVLQNGENSKVWMLIK